MIYQQPKCPYSYFSLALEFNLRVLCSLWVSLRSEACDFVRKCFAKITRRKFLDNLKQTTAQDPCRRTSGMESFLMKLMGWTLDLQLEWKKASAKDVYNCECIKTFRASVEGFCMSSDFLITFRVVYYRAAALLRRWSTMDFFLKKILFLLFFLNSYFSVHFLKRICHEFFL